MNLPFRIIGVVKKNVGRGKKLGFPTANIEAPKDAKDGIYLGYTTFLPPLPNPSHPLDLARDRQVKRKLERLPSLLFIGAAVTFDETKRFAESYILDFHGNLYGKNIELEFVEYVRESRRFISGEEMRKQIEEDKRIARVFFANK